MSDWITCPHCSDEIPARYKPTHCYSCNHPISKEMLAAIPQPYEPPFYSEPPTAFLIAIGASIGFVALIFVSLSLLNIHPGQGVTSGLALATIAIGVSVYRSLAYSEPE